MARPDTPLGKRQAVARRFAQHLDEYSDVAVVLVFGSVATGHVDDASDINLLVVCEPDPLELAVRRGRTEALGEGWTSGTTGDPMFPLIDECRSSQGVGVTLHHQRAAWLERVLGEVLTRGAITTREVPFRPYTLASLLSRAWVLGDKRGTVAGWRARTATFLPALKQNLSAHFVPLLREHTEELTANVRRRLGAVSFLFHLNWGVDAMIEVLYALNGIYDPEEKRAERTIWPHFRVAPENFSQRLAAVLEGPFNDKAAVQKAEQFRKLADEILALSR